MREITNGDSRNLDPLARIIAHSRSKQDALRELLPQAEAGNLPAIFAVAGLHARCHDFDSPPQSRLTAVIPERIRSQRRWKVAYAELEKYCGQRTDLDARADAIWSKQDNQIATLSEHDALASLYMDAQANGGKVPAESANAAVDLLKTHPDGETTQRAAYLLLTSEDARIRAIDSDVFGRMTDGKDVQKVKVAVSMLYACQNGYYCAGRGTYQLERCLLTGWCNRSLPLRHYLQTYELSGGQMKMLEAYLAALQNTLDR